MKNKNYLAFGSAIAAVFFWSLSFIWFKVAYLAYNPITVVIFRLSISSMLVLVIARLLSRLQKPSRKDLGLFAMMSFFEPFLYFLGESYGLKYVSPTVAAVIVATIPLITPVVAWYFYRENVGWKNIAGLIFSFAGVGLVVLNADFRFDASPLGVGLEFAAVLSAIGYTVILRKIASRYNTLTIIAYQNLIGAIFFLPFWLIFDFRDFIQTPFHPQAFRAIILLAIFASTLAFIFFTQTVRRLGITRSNTFINLIPVFVAIFSFFILHENIDIQKIIGIVIVVTGLFLAQIGQTKKPGKEKPVEVHEIS